MHSVKKDQAYDIDYAVAVLKLCFVWFSKENSGETEMKGQRTFMKSFKKDSFNSFHYFVRHRNT